MPVAALLNDQDPIYDFEHMMATRQYFVIMELTKFSVLPYLLDPSYNTESPATSWHQNHQQSHDDFNNSLPAYWNDNFIGFGIPQRQNLREGATQNEDNRAWWTFVNHQEHYIATNAISPLPWDSPPGWWRQIEAGYPFW